MADDEKVMKKDGEHTWLVGFESNPDMFNRFTRAMGMSAEFEFNDVFSFDASMLEFQPQPVLGIVFLAPYTAMKPIKLAQEQRFLANGPENSVDNDKVTFIRQKLRNSCGGHALIHMLVNLVKSGQLDVPRDSFCAKFVDQLRSVSDPDERGLLIEKAEGIASVYGACALEEGQTEAPEPDADLDHHFVAFVRLDDCVCELDGGKKFAVNHGKTSAERFFTDAVGVMQREFVDKLPPGELYFSAIALAKPPQ
jgi:ubiquitin carboxyl-terminal hydrolase L3